jgi:hypothetical protein
MTMKVKAVKSFAGMAGNTKYRVSAGDEFDLPAGTDWLKAGLVVPLAGSTPAKASTPNKTAAKPSSAKRGRPRKTDVSTS